jgi:PAS domain S-box-containing protein
MKTRIKLVKEGVVMEKKLNVLIVEDLISDAELAEREIRKTLTDIDVKLVDTEDEFRNALTEFKPDLIVSDYQMPVFDGLTALRITRETTKFIPFIILTGSVNEDTAVLCMKTGADDYVLKEHIKRLGSAINHAIKTKEIEKTHFATLQNLKESEEKYRSLIEDSNDGIFLLYDGKFEIVNKKLEEMFGYTQDEINQDSDFLNLVTPKSRNFLQDRIFKSAQGKAVNSKYEFTGLTKSGNKIELEASVSYIPYKNSKATQSIIRDITDRKKTEKELIEAKEKAEESDRLKSAFLMNISHEIRTPMNGILGFMDLLLKPGLSVEDKFTYSNIIKQSSNRLLNTITDLIDLAHIETNQVEVTLSELDISEVLLYNIFHFKSLADDNNNKLVIKNKTDERVFVLLDKNKLNRILSNLISNAVKFTQNGTIEVGYHLQDHQIEFYISDTGIGIPEEKHQEIFESFVQADLSLSRAYEGTGLGLTITKAYVEMLGGKIRVESEEGKGSVFYVNLPFEKRIQQVTNNQQEQKRETELKNAKVLIVEDDKMSAEYLSELIREKSGKLLFAENGEKALQICKQHIDVDLILMDIKMPKMDGKTATKKIREFNKQVIIIAQTDFALDGDQDELLKAGCNDYIEKPIQEETLFSIIGKYFKN